MRSALKIAEAVREGNVTARAVAEDALARAREVEPNVHAFLYLDADHVLAQADAIDAERRAGCPLGPLAGVPIAVKDAFCTLDMPTTAGSKILQRYRPPYDAAAVARLRSAGAVVFGKTNLDEFGMGSTTEWSAYQTTHNPWHLQCSPGGSSGGSAAAVAAGIVPLALGSDTGGSVRQPAAYTGIWGMKPSYGRIPRTGLIAYASSLDHVGVFATTGADAVALMQILAGPDGSDATARTRAPRPVVSLSGLRVGVPREWLALPIGDPQREAVERAQALLAEHGAQMIDVSIPHTEHLVAAYYVLACAEAASNLGRYDGIRYGVRAESQASLRGSYVATRSEGFGEECRRRILLGTFVLSSGYYDAYYTRALRARAALVTSVEGVFRTVDLVLGPTTLGPAPRLGSRGTPIETYASDILTLPANLTGCPALSVPMGKDAQGLPVSVQLMGNIDDEWTVIAAGEAIASTWERAPCI